MPPDGPPSNIFTFAFVMRAASACARSAFLPIFARYSGNMNAFMLLSDQTIWATIARILRQSGPERQGVHNR